MNNYVVLVVLNVPLALYGMFNVILDYKINKARFMPVLIRLIFWGLIILGIFFVRPITDFVDGNSLSDSPPISLVVVLLATGVDLCFILITRAYSRIADLEDKFTQLQEKLSVKLSK